MYEYVKMSLRNRKSTGVHDDHEYTLSIAIRKEVSFDSMFIDRN